MTGHSGHGPKSVTFKRKSRSRSPGKTGHVPPERPVTLGRNRRSESAGILRIEGGDILLLDLYIEDFSGNVIFKLTDNRVRVQIDKDVTFEHYPGRVLVTAPASERFIRRDDLAIMRKAEPNFALGDRLTMVDVEVLAPGQVKVLGTWVASDKAFFITHKGVSFLKTGWPAPGAVRNLALQFSGIITAGAFRL